MPKLAHIVNPFLAEKTSDLFAVQPITFKSMLAAKDFCRQEADVELLSAQFAEDTAAVPAEFRQTKNLQRSALDGHTFQTRLKLPFLYDILERAYTESDADYLIYTNVDIGLYPDFYSKVNQFITNGHDAFIINRRRIPDTFITETNLDILYKEKGKKHPGFDCFVFHRSLFPKLKLEGICIGVPFIEIAFSQNLFALSNTFKLFENEYMTFHIGMEIFRKRAPREYFNYNRRQFWKLIKQLDPLLDLKKFPYSKHPWPVRFIKWGLHPCIPIRLVLKLELKALRDLFTTTKK